MVEEDDLLVIGHRRPDLDSIAAAVGYAALLGELGRPARGARCGPLDAQAEFALGRFEVEGPPLVPDVSPTFGRIARKIEPLTPESPLAQAIAAISDGGRAVPIVDPDGRPRALLDAEACVRRLGLAARSAGLPASEASIRAAAKRAIEPCIEPGEPCPALYAANERVADRRATIARAEPDDFLVVDGAGRYTGVASRAAVLAPPRRKLVLVDHNEIGQAVPGADEAEIVEVLDHHRLGAPATREPIPFTVDTVGSTSTLVAERFAAAGLEPPRGLAGLLLAGILSDTLAFRSPTSTKRDERAAARLAARAGVEDLAAFGEEVVAAGAGIGRRAAEEVVGEDYKEYKVAAGGLVISQAEVRSLAEASGREDELGGALDRLREARGAALGLLLLTDVLRGKSALIARGDERLIGRLPFPPRSGGTYDAGRIVSRKKELVPAVLAALE